MSFQIKLLDWFKENRRPFPWRNKPEPYNVWLSEIILQQTRAAQGLPYYESFISNFPTIEKLARAKEDEIMRPFLMNSQAQKAVLLWCTTMTTKKN